MSHKALPLVFINLTGEMMYVLDQRLRAQNIEGDKQKKGTGEYRAATGKSRLGPITVLAAIGSWVLII